MFLLSTIIHTRECLISMQILTSFYLIFIDNKHVFYTYTNIMLAYEMACQLHLVDTFKDKAFQSHDHNRGGVDTCPVPFHCFHRMQTRTQSATTGFLLKILIALHNSRFSTKNCMFIFPWKSGKGPPLPTPLVSFL